MLTGELKNKIDMIWEMFWTGGIVNPLDVVEQMTYLMFIHDLDETDAKKAKSSMMLELPYTSMFEGHDQYKWSVFRDLPPRRCMNLCRVKYSRLLRICTAIKKALIRDICPMLFLRYQPRSYSLK